jgi:hypothetical protein
MFYSLSLLIMEWKSVNEQLPEVGDDGESEYVLACNCRTRCVPMVVKYSNGLYSMKGWHSNVLGKYLPLNRMKEIAGTTLSFTHWMKIELPNIG